MPWLSEKDILQEEARQIDPTIYLTTKNSWFWHMLAWVLFLLSFGKFKREDFLSSFSTTFGHVQAYPEEWDPSTVRRVMIHESRHTYQARIFGLGIHPIIGLPLMGLCYVFLPFPILFAFIRFWLELDADKTSWKYMLEGRVSPNTIRTRAKYFAEDLSSSSYLWSVWRTFALSQFSKAAEKVIAEHLRENI